MNNSVVDLQSVVLSLTLTKWGALFLSAFPLEAIQWSDKHYQTHGASHKGSKEPFKRFVNLCVDWCSQQNMKPAWRPMYEEQRAQGMPLNAPMIENQKVRAGEPAKSNRTPDGRQQETHGLSRRMVNLTNDKRFTKEESIEQAQKIYEHSESFLQLSSLLGQKSATEFRDRVIANHINNLV